MWTIKIILILQSVVWNPGSGTYCCCRSNNNWFLTHFRPLDVFNGEQLQDWFKKVGLLQCSVEHLKLPKKLSVKNEKIIKFVNFFRLTLNTPFQRWSMKVKAYGIVTSSALISFRNMLRMIHYIRKISFPAPGSINVCTSTIAYCL